DPLATARAAWVDVTSHGLNQGGSTITQQLVKIQLLTPQKSVTRKVQEIVLAVALEQRYSKDQILEMYLNRVYFGHGAYGVGSARPRCSRAGSLSEPRSTWTCRLSPSRP